MGVFLLALQREKEVPEVYMQPDKIRTLEYNKTPRHPLMTGCRIRKWQLPTLPPGGAVPSAMVSLTSLFGMGRGGSSPL